jgi:capsular polysaccharide biosynthesis protein
MSFRSRRTKSCRRRPGASRLRHYLLRDTVLDGNTMTLLRAGQPLRETGYLQPEHIIANLKQDSVIDDGDGTRTIIGSNFAHRNYYHWLIQAIPTIDTAVRRNEGRDVRLALAPENDFQRDSLALLGHDALRHITIEPGRQYALREAEYSDFLLGSASFLTSLREMETFARLRAAVPARRQPRERIYVARTDAPVRRMRNEDQLIEKLRARGFRIVAPGSLAFRDQAALFRHASFVVGPHGAGLSNIVFCEPGTLVYELVPALYRNSCFAILADLGGLRYWADMFESEGAGAGFTGEWDVDVESVLRRIDDIEALSPPRRRSFIRGLLRLP